MIPTPDEKKLDCRILLVEDCNDTTMLLSCLLENAGAKVTTAYNGKICIDLAISAWQEGKPFDLLLMDIQMPLVDGYTAAKILRQKGYTGPMIAMTARALPAEVAQAREAGFDEYLTKASGKEKLFATLFKHIRKPLDPHPEEESS